MVNVIKLQFRFYGQIAVVCMIGFLMILAGGCKSNMAMQGDFAKIKVARTTSNDVLAILAGNKGMLRTDNSVAVLNKTSGCHETGIVVFRQADTLVRRKDYLQQCSAFPYEKMLLHVETAVPDKIINQPYENNLQKNIALLRFCHQAIVDDSRPFSEDRSLESQAGMARTALGVGIHQLTIHPEEGYKIGTAEGFQYDHPILGRCTVKLKVTPDNILTVSLTSQSLVDPFVKW